MVKKLYRIRVMGIKGSKPILTPSELTNTILKMLSSKDSGSFGSFIKKENLFKNPEEIIQFIKTNFNILLQYPISLSDTRLRLTPRMQVRKGLSKKFIHKILEITNETSKEQFLQKIVDTSSITSFKVFLAKEEDKFNTFEREILRYREQLETQDTVYQNNIAVAEIQSKLMDYPFKVPENHFFANSENLKLLNTVPITYISFSLKLKNTTQVPEFLHKIDFIFLKECKGGSLNTVQQIDFFKLIRDIIPAIHNLHSNNIYHMDIKVDNILKCDKTYKLIDFGLSYNIPQVDNKTITTQKQANKYINEYVYNIKEQDNNIQKQIIDLQNLDPTKDSIIDNYIKSLVPNSAIFYINPILLAFIYKMLFDTEQRINSILIDLKDSYETTITTNISKSINYKTDLLDKFMVHYNDYVKADNYIDFDKIKEDYHNFIRKLYQRHDWYCFAITLLLLYDKFQAVPEFFKKGIQQFISLKDEDLSNPNLDKKLIEQFYFNNRSKKTIKPTYYTVIK